MVSGTQTPALSGRRRFGVAAPDHGQAGMERWVGLGILAHNLRQISRSIVAQRAA